MKYKSYYILMLLLLVCAGVNAQKDTNVVESPLQQQNLNTDERTKTELGIKFTMGAHTFRGDAFDNKKLLYGFGAGIYNIINLNKKKTLKLQWELDGNMKGSKFGTVNDTSFSKISLAYIDVPVMLSIQVLNTPQHRPLHLLIGGQFSYLLRSTLNKSYGKYGDVRTDLPFKRYDVAPIIGLRKEVGSGISLQFCFKYGLLNNYTDGFRQRTIHPDPDNKNYDYRDILPTLKDGTHQNRNTSFELSLMFSP